MAVIFPVYVANDIFMFAICISLLLHCVYNTNAVLRTPTDCRFRIQAVIMQNNC